MSTEASVVDRNVEERLVRVYRLDWRKWGEHDEDIELDTVYYAAKHADQIWPHVERMLKEVPDSTVSIDTEELPLVEWVGEYSGDAEDAEP